MSEIQINQNSGKLEEMVKRTGVGADKLNLDSGYKTIQ